MKNVEQSKKEQEYNSKIIDIRRKLVENKYAVNYGQFNEESGDGIIFFNSFEARDKVTFEHYFATLLLANPTKKQVCITEDFVFANSEGVKTFFDLLANNPRIDELSFDSNTHDEEIVKSFLKEISKNNTIKSLIYRKDNALEAYEVEMIQKVIETNSTINLLDLSGKEEIDEPTIQAICNSMQKNYTITDLLLVDCGLSDNEILHISNLLRNNFTIKQLSLSSNNITDKGVKELSSALIKNSSIKFLELDGNSVISNKGAEYLLKSLKKNINLTSINLDNTEVDIDYTDKITFYADKRVKLLNEVKKHLSDQIINLYTNLEEGGDVIPIEKASNEAFFSAKFPLPLMSLVSRNIGWEGTKLASFGSKVNIGWLKDFFKLHGINSLEIWKTNFLTVLRVCKGDPEMWIKDEEKTKIEGKDIWSSSYHIPTDSWTLIAMEIWENPTLFESSVNVSGNMLQYDI